ncbi:MAG: RNA-binding S4 domain-containing protein [Aquihabitans sp.]
MRTTPIRDASIRLGQFLKLSGLIDGGGEAKVVIEGGRVEVNGTVERRRGHHLQIGDVVALDGESVQVTGSEG